MRTCTGKTVYVDVGEREISEGTRLLSWTTRPTGVRFAFADGRKGSLVKDDEGVVYLNLPMRIIIR